MKASIRPWYREPWPWLLMSGPVIVIIAGVWTTWLAVRSSDGLVTDDYYKEGLTINRSLERDDKARAAGITADASFGLGGRVRLVIPGGLDKDVRELRLQLLHPTRAGMDQSVALQQLAPGLWEGRIAAVPEGAWRLQLDAGDAGWRIVGSWPAGSPSAVLRPIGAEQRS